jgi:hypothetical protein
MTPFPSPTGRFARLACLSLVLVLAACSDSGPTPNPLAPETPAASVASVVIAPTSANVSVDSTVQLTATVRDAAGQTMNRSVTWTSSNTAIATVSGGLVRGVAAGSATITATSEGRSGSAQVSVSAPAPARARYTVLVYLAADNNLSWAGVKDIDEMEAAGSSDDVKIVVQAEFSREYTEKLNCTPACFNRPNYNTFRYLVPRGNSKRGPDGPVQDIGNRNMADPAELADFIRWGTETYPAERYILVLWNHGAGYVGLIDDDTSSPGRSMSIAELREALQAANTRFEIINFDMCLMGGVETAVSVREFTNFAVFSEEVVPNDGNPYDRILGTLRQAPTMSGNQAARMFVEEFVASYRGGRSSATLSAVDMSRLPGFMTAWEALSAELDTNLAAHRPALSAAISGSQNYTYSFLRDLGDLLARLRQQSNSPTLHARIDAVRTELNGGIVVRNLTYNGHGYQEPDVSRSTGMSILMPSGLTADALPANGPGSFQSYRALYSSLRWTGFLEKWLAGGPSQAMLDQGASTFQLALVWDPAAVPTGVDIDLWVLEPSGDLFIPYLGVVTPNGTFSGDSYNTSTYFETYSTRRHVQRGIYYFFADLYSDPRDFRPSYNVLFRFFPASSEWRSLYSSPFPALSKQTSWRDDPQPSLQKAVNRAYTDLRLVATWDISASQSAGAAGSVPLRDAPRPESGLTTVPGGPASRVLESLPAEQMTRVLDMLRDPQVQARRAAARAQEQRARQPVDVPADFRRQGEQLRGERERRGVQP